MDRKTNMYCDQCQEAAAGSACTRMGMCGIDEKAANLRDLLIYVTKGICAAAAVLRSLNQEADAGINRLVIENLVMCSVNVNFDADVYCARITETIAAKSALLEKIPDRSALPSEALFEGAEETYTERAKVCGPSETSDPDIRGLREMILFAMQGVAAFMKGAMDLGYDDEEIHAYIQDSLTKTTDPEIRGGELIANVLEAGRYGIRAMKLEGLARRTVFGNPEAVEVSLAAGSKPGILVSGDSYADLAELLRQSEGQGVDVYTYSDLLSAHAYPELRKYDHFVGHYGGAWWNQKEEFEAFNGPVLVTSDEFTTPRRTYADRIFTTGPAGYPGCTHIAAGEDGKKDFSALIACAKTCEPPKATEGGTVVAGYSYDQLVGRGEELAGLLKRKKIHRLVLMLGSDGRAKNRSYYTDFARALPENAVIFTAGSVRFRFSQYVKGETNGLPRLFDAGDISEMYKIAEMLMTVQEHMDLNDIAMLPVYYNVAWYDPKSVIMLLELLYIGVKNVHVGPSPLGFLSRPIRQVFSGYFSMKENGEVEEEIKSYFGESGGSISADMIVGDIVEEYPELVPVMLSVGLHCLGCGVSQIETLKEACEVHGLDVYDVLEILNDELQHPEEDD